MDGQRRIAEPLRKNARVGFDCALRYRIAARGFAVSFLATALVHGIVSGGHLAYPGSPWPKLPGHLAGVFGMAAIDIELTGLQHHDAREVLNYIGVKPGGALFDFDAKRARDKLQELDWVESATVVRRFPNQLQIRIAEREPFVVWQHKGKFAVVDQQGKPMSGISAQSSNILLHVVGEGANTSASQLVNQMEATPGLRREVRAAVRVGDRRWDLHMTNGLVFSLPEKDADTVLKTVEAQFAALLKQQFNIKRIDYRIAGEVIYQADTQAQLLVSDPTTTSSLQ
jgi:cell division protein FtsQ